MREQALPSWGFFCSAPRSAYAAVEGDRGLLDDSPRFRAGLMLTLAAAHGIVWLMRTIVFDAARLRLGEGRFRPGPAVWMMIGKAVVRAGRAKRDAVPEQFLGALIGRLAA